MGFRVVQHLPPDLRDTFSFRTDALEQLSSDQSPSGFFRYDYMKDIDEVIKAVAAMPLAKNLVHVGLGGSSLGPKLLVDAIPQHSSKRIHFIENVDPDVLAETLGPLDLEDTIFYFVSKSGTTLETLALLRAIRGQFSNSDESSFFDRCWFATSNKNSPLGELAKIKNRPILNIPNEIGGRFCLFTCVGMLPAIFAGMDAKATLMEVAKTKQRLQTPGDDLRESLLSLSAVTTGLMDRGIHETVVMPYSSKLKTLGPWFVQLWAESLGKVDRYGNAKGLTPIAAYGSTDQHSQMQLFMEGPRNKLILMMSPPGAHNRATLSKIPDLASRDDINELGEVLQACYTGNLEALLERQRPVIEFQLSELPEKLVGPLALFFMTLTAVTGERLKVDPFNQPGVELGKQLTKKYFDRPKEEQKRIAQHL